MSKPAFLLVKRFKEETKLGILALVGDGVLDVPKSPVVARSLKDNSKWM